MHELSIIASIVDIAQAEVAKAGASHVESIELEIGELAGVEWQALDFAWEVGVQRSVLEHAELQLTRIPGHARCTECNSSFLMENIYDPCPGCGSYFNEILSGKELRIKALTVT
jgi:hydrogenase nickel incorporation protein HypA/HybF